MNVSDIWLYLSQTPLLWLTVTLLVYQISLYLYIHFDSLTILNPTVLSIIIVVVLLKLSNTDYSGYFDGAQFIHFLLGPAIIALALPLYAMRIKLTALFIPITGAMIAGSCTAVMSVVIVGDFLGISQSILLSMVPKSVTAPVAMGISEQINGLPSLTGVMVVLTGVMGAILAPYIFRLLRITDYDVRGIAIGLTSHGIGTARAFQISNEKGAFSGLAMGLNAVLTALLTPIMVRWFSL